MQYSEVSARYAKALFELAQAENKEEQIFNELRGFSQVIHSSKEINDFVHSILVKPVEKEAALDAAIKDKGLSQVVEDFIKLLASGGRLKLIEEIEYAFQELIDKKNGVTRGVVKSSKSLSSEERKLIESRVAQALNKSVILTYKEDPSIIGGLIAEAGGYRFDDSLISHLKRLKEVMNRSAH